MAGVSLRNVVKKFGAVGVINDATLDVADGEFVVFVGPSGCGKSTLLRMIAGLEETSGGEISIGGKVVTDVEPADRGTAMVFQSYALYPHMTVEQNLGFGLRMTGNPKADTAAKVKRASEILRITELMQRRPKQLSGGQRQRVAIGRAIVREPQVFLFDEPLSNLDAELRVQMRVEIARLHKELGITMIYVTHDQTEAMTLANRIVVLRSGNIEQVGRPLDLYRDPDNQFVAGFLGSPRMNFMAARIIEHGLTYVTVELANQAGTKLNIASNGEKPAIGAAVTVGVRPEHFPFAVAGDPEINVSLDLVEHLGDSAYGYANTASTEPLIVSLGATDTEVAIGDLPVRIPQAYALLFSRDGERLR